jgi:hypothetical protein
MNPTVLPTRFTSDVYPPESAHIIQDYDVACKPVPAYPAIVRTLQLAVAAALSAPQEYQDHHTSVTVTQVTSEAASGRAVVPNQSRCRLGGPVCSHHFRADRFVRSQLFSRQTERRCPGMLGSMYNDGDMSILTSSIDDSSPLLSVLTHSATKPTTKY